MATTINANYPLALGALPNLRTKQMVPAVIMSRICRALSTHIDSLANNGSAYVSTGAAPAAAGTAMPNGTTAAEITAFYTALVQYFARNGTSKLIDEDVIFMGPTQANGVANAVLTVFAFKELCEDMCTNATIFPNFFDRTQYHLRRVLRWFTREAVTFCGANGNANQTCLKYGIPFTYKKIAFDFFNYEAYGQSLDDMHLMAHNAYYLLATETDAGQVDATASANFTRGNRTTTGRRRYH